MREVLAFERAGELGLAPQLQIDVSSVERESPNLEAEG